MNAFKVIAGMIVAAAAVVAINSASASATTGTPMCTVKPVPMSDWTKSFKFSGDKVTATFTLEGDANCQYDMTLAAFEGPKGIQPVKDQLLFSNATGRFGKGTHTLTTSVPDCYFQLDMFTGVPLPTDSSKVGTRYHDFVNTGNFVNMDKWHTDGNTARLIDFYEGGDKKCEDPEEPEDVCPNLDGSQSEVPEGHELDKLGQCVIPEEPEQPKGGKGAAKGEQTLPVTGPASIIGTFAGVSGAGAVAHAVVNRKKRQ